MRCSMRHISSVVYSSVPVSSRHSPSYRSSRCSTISSASRSSLSRRAGLQVEQLAVDVRQPDVEVVRTLAVAERLVQLAGLGVHEVRRELTGAATEQHVGQRHVSPEEAGQVQPHHEHDERVEDLGQAAVRQAVAEQRPVGQRVLQVAGHQRRLDLLAVLALAAADDADGLDGRQRQPSEVAEQAVLTVGHPLAGLLDRVDVLPEPHDAYDVSRDAPRQRHDHVVAPLLQRQVPGQRHQGRVGLRGDDAQGHATSLGPAGLRRRARGRRLPARAGPPRRRGCSASSCGG